MTIRSTYFLGLVAICILLATSIGLQIFAGFTPCPLCTLQRMTFVLLGILFLVGVIVYAKHSGRLIVNSLCGLTSVIGIGLAGRQVWLQHFPPNNSECGVSLQYMLQVLPMSEVMKKVFAGTAECTQRGWEFLHLNMAEWSLLWFVIFLLLTICLFLEELKFKL